MEEELEKGIQNEVNPKSFLVLLLGFTSDFGVPDLFVSRFETESQYPVRPKGSHLSDNFLRYFL